MIETSSPAIPVAAASALVDERTAETAAALMDIASSSPVAAIVSASDHSSCSTDDDEPTSPTTALSDTGTRTRSSTVAILGRENDDVHTEEAPPVLSVGVGIAVTVTEAAVKAVRDAMVRDPLDGRGTSSSLLSDDQKDPTKRLVSIKRFVSIQLGIPATSNSSISGHSNSNGFDVAALQQQLVLPMDVEIVHPILIQTGGMAILPFVGSSRAKETIETANLVMVVACVSVHAKVTTPTDCHRSNTDLIHQEPSNDISMARQVSIDTDTKVPNECRSTIPPVLTTPTLVSHGFYPSMDSNRRIVPLVALPSEMTTVQDRTRRKSTTNSMEMLASISTAMMVQHEQEQIASGSTLRDAVHEKKLNDMVCCGIDEKQAGGDMRYAFKRLPPGKTSKNNNRLFVQHSYRDYSHEPFLVEPAMPQTNVSGQGDGKLTWLAQPRTPNAAFPLKLHEILSQIERDGHEDIIGWLPHGRSFQIFNQQEFVTTVLPKYFVMTKKSSFLRQLNLYGFNRLSGGSYYHEKFLRGLKMLSSRMQRVKVNGNGIRAAGNPEEEPNLASFPTCPQTTTPSMIWNTSTDGSNDLGTEALVSFPTLIEGSTSSSSCYGARTPQPTEGMRRNSYTSTGRSSNASVDSDSSCESEFLTITRNSKLAQEAAKPDGSVSDMAHTAKETSGSSDISMILPQPTLPPVIMPVVVRGKTVLYQQETFPLKLQRILDKFEAEGQSDILCWLSHGRAFLVRDVDRFVNEVLPLYFNQTKYSSFQRQCHMYNFTRLTQLGPDKGAYFHENLQRGQPELSAKLKRTRVNGKGTRRPGNPREEPDFRALPALAAVASGTIIEIPHA